MGDAAWIGDDGGRPTRRWLRRIGIILIVCLAVLLGAAAAIAFYAKSEIDDFVTPRSAAMRKAQRQLEAPLPGEPANILLLGSDHRKTDGGKAVGDDDQRSDTMLLVRLDPKRETISMLSLPRDLYVPIPGHGSSKINEAYHLGGPDLAVQTVKELTDLDINFVMNVDFQGFRGVVDKIGGIWVDSEHTFFNNQQDQTSDIDIKPGYQLMNGMDALAYSRYRHDSQGDFTRIARQQQVLDAFKAQFSQSFSAKRVPGLFQLLKDNTEVAAGGGDKLDYKVLYNYMRLALKLDRKDVYQVEYAGVSGTGPGGASIVEFEQAKLDTAVAAFLAPSAKAREQTADQLVGKAAPSADGTAADATDAADTAPKAPSAPDPSTVSVRVLNGSLTAGVARNMAEQLTQGGYKVDPEQTNADASSYTATKVQFATAADKPAAVALAKQIKGAVAVPKDDTNPFATQLLVIVGQTGQQYTAPAGGAGAGDPAAAADYAGNAVPDKTEANVSTDPGWAAQSFLETSSKRFPIEAPTVYERSSSVDEVYPYQIVKGGTVYDAYRMVAKTAEGEYWGLQGMSWANPPILADPTRTVLRGRRTYLLYFNGTKLHRVAWHDGTGTYWIANSPLDSLDNPTMLAIAYGVQPIG
ncbi:MAG: LytR family transcriptional regulator [Thermoleophilia bacterium]|nr:LytR family transcriptional regulator [Thermoleophilia bacterium]